MWAIIFLSFLLCTAAFGQIAERPTLSIYTNSGDNSISNEASLDIRKYKTKLDLSCMEPFSRYATLHYCAGGFWIHYAKEDYENNSTLWLPGSCIVVDTSASPPASFRFPSHPYNISAPTVTVYNGEGYHGEDYKLYESTPEFRFIFRSFVAITTSVRLWTQYEYAGNSTCIRPGMEGGSPIAYSSSIDTEGDLGLAPGSVRSIEFVFTCE